MTVQELIEELDMLDPNAIVQIAGQHTEIISVTQERINSYSEFEGENIVYLHRD